MSAEAVSAVYQQVKIIVIDGSGLGKELMGLVDDEARKLGVSSIALHVFAHNQVARALYEKMGYRTTNLWMSKDL